MAVSYTHTSLRAALLDTTENAGIEYTAALDNIIALAETKVLRDLNIELFDQITTGNFTANDPVVTKPTGMVALRTLHYADGVTGNYSLIEPKSWEYLKDYWPLASVTTATPKFVTDYSETQWYLAGTPASALAYSVRYVKRPDGLSASVTNTWLSDNVGDLLFYACLVCSEQYLKADNRIGVWKQDYTERLPATRMELRRDRRDDYAPVVGTPDAGAQ